MFILLSVSTTQCPGTGNYCKTVTLAKFEISRILSTAELTSPDRGAHSWRDPALRAPFRRMPADPPARQPSLPSPHRTGRGSARTRSQVRGEDFNPTAERDQDVSAGHSFHGAVPVSASKSEKQDSTRGLADAAGAPDIAMDKSLDGAVAVSALQSEVQDRTHGLRDLNDAQQEALLNQALEPLRLRSGSTPKDGNCLLHAVIDQWRQYYGHLEPPVPMHNARALRAALWQRMRDRPIHQEFRIQEEWERTLQQTKKNGSWLGEEHLVYLADMLAVRIVVVPAIHSGGSSYNGTGGLTYNGTVPAPPSAQPLVLGWLNELHYTTTFKMMKSLKSTDCNRYDPGPDKYVL
jgi:hypothetical protein